MFPFIPIAVGVLGSCSGVSCGVGISASKALAIAGASLGASATAGAIVASRRHNSVWTRDEKRRILKELLDNGKISLEEYNTLMR